MRGRTAQNGLAAVLLVVPLTSEVGWQALTYRGIRPNVVRFGEQGLEIRVTRSASPIVYRLAAPVTVQGVSARGRINGRLDVSADRQGKRGFDDYTLRLGLVETGQRRLRLTERAFAPEWLRQLFRLAPADAGITQVHFFNLGVDASQIGQKRRHPLSTLLQEEIVAVPASDGRFGFSLSFKSAIQTAAIWISADGDDTKSEFIVTLHAIELETS